MNTLIYMTFLHILLGLNVVTNEQVVVSEIEAVTVYTNSARVTRVSKLIQVTENNSLLVLEKLSPFIDQESVQVLLEGNGTINSVKFRRNYSESESNDEAITSMKDKISANKDSIELIDLRVATIMARKDFLESNKYVKGEYMTMTLSDLSSINDYYTDELAEILVERYRLEKKKVEYLDDNRILAKQVLELKPNLDQVPQDLLVNVSPKGSGDISLKVIYKVTQAGWYTTYDMRADAIDKPINLVQKANVFQNTGEDWKDVILSFSNENTSYSKSLPELYPQYLPPRPRPKQQKSTTTYHNPATNTISGYVFDSRSGESIPFATIQLDGNGIGTSSDYNGYYELKLPPTHSGVLNASFIGYTSQQLQITQNRMNFHLQENHVALDEVVISAYKVPLVSMDMTTSGSVIMSEEIRGLPSKNISGMASSSSGLKSKNVKDVSVSGSRNKATHYYIDGKRVEAGYESATPKSSIEESELNFKFTMESPYTILSDGKINDIGIRPIEMGADFVYRAVPKLSSSVYLTAYVDDWEDKNLTVGNMNLYFEGAYIGQSLLDPTKTKDSIILSLGVDSKITFERELVRSYNKKVPLTSKKTTEIVYETTIKNQKSKAIKLEVWDQIPISALKDIEVNDVMFSDVFALNADNGIGHWKVNMKAKGQEKLKMEYTVKYPNRFHFQL